MTEDDMTKDDMTEDGMTEDGMTEDGMTGDATSGATSPDPTPTGQDRVVAVTRVIAADPQAIFDVLADPAQHVVIDGSSSVKGALPGAPTRLSLGARFGMSMRIGAPYRITNEVVEFDEGRRIAWRHAGGHVWRYRLEPVEGGTQVTEEFDWRSSRGPALLRLMKVPERNRASMVATLDRLDRLVTSA